MEFFDWMNIPQQIVQWILSYYYLSEDSTAEYVAYLGNLATIISLIAAGVIFLLFLVLGGIGLNTMAKRAGKKTSFLAYLPFGNTYFTGKLVGEANFFGQKMKRAGLYAMLIELLYSALEISRIVLNFMLNRPEYYTARKLAGTEAAYWDIERSLIPENLRWQYDFLNYSGIVSYIIFFLAIVFLITLYMALFRKYYAKSPILMTLLCTILPFRGAAVFAVRKNNPVDYNEYLRKRMESMSRGAPYGRPYGEYNPPQDGSPSGQTPPSAPPEENPFGEFDDDSDDPFHLDDKN